MAVQLNLAIFAVISVITYGSCNSILESELSAAKEELTSIKTTVVEELEAMKEQCKTVNQALSDLVNVVEQSEEEDDKVMVKRSIAGNSAIADITIGELINAHRSYGDKVGSPVGQGGSSYVRWGRKSCGETAQELYSGLAAGTAHGSIGGASNYICLPSDPEYNKYTATDTSGWVSGAEYESGSNIFDKSLQDQNVPCARCYVPTRSETIMIPAKRTCPDSWTKEYEGYLMSGHPGHNRGYNYVCMDQQPEALTGLQGSKNGALFYFQQSQCSTLGRCPPYIQGAELACVVCSK